MGSLPYDLSLSVVQSYFRDKDLVIWSRNGHAMKTLTPGVSDLDITIYTGLNSFSDLNEIQTRYMGVKRILPFLGEINWIDKFHAPFFSNFCNPHEADRDIILRDLTGYKRDSQGALKACFFLRCLASDTYGIRENFKTRKKKWQKHMKDLGIGTSSVINSTSDLFRCADEELVKKLIGQSSTPFLRMFYNQKHGDINAWNRFYGNVEVKDFMLFAPNYWIGASLHHGKYESDVELLNNFNEAEFSLLRAQLEWEIWGLFTQYKLVEDKENLIQHLLKLRDFSKSVPGASLIGKGFDKLIELQV